MEKCNTHATRMVNAARHALQHRTLNLQPHLLEFVMVDELYRCSARDIPARSVRRLRWGTRMGVHGVSQTVRPVPFLGLRSLFGTLVLMLNPKPHMQPLKRNCNSLT